MNTRDFQTGKTILCYGCGSRFHLHRNCSKNQESLINVAYNSVEEVLIESVINNNSTLNTTDIIIDSAATKTVCGREWLNKFTSDHGHDRIIKTYKSNTIFKFGDDAKRHALFGIYMKVYLCGKLYTLSIDVVNGMCPLLLSRPVLSKLGFIIDFGKSELKTKEGHIFHLKQSKKGHLLLPILDENCTSVESLITFGTCKWFLSCVGPFMRLQSSSVDKSLVTLGTGKWLLSCVGPFMHHQIST